MTACHAEHPENDRFNKQVNKRLKLAVLEARKAMIPNNYIERVIQLAKQGFKSIEFPEYVILIGILILMQTVSGQNSNNSIRVTNEFMNAVLMIKIGISTGELKKEKSKEENRNPKPCQNIKSKRSSGMISLLRHGLLPESGDSISQL